MLTTDRDRFARSKQDRLPDESFFRELRQNWRPMVRRGGDYDRLSDRGRRAGSVLAKPPPAKPTWTPWLWVGT